MLIIIIKYFMPVMKKWRNEEMKKFNFQMFVVVLIQEILTVGVIKIKQEKFSINFECLWYEF